MNFQCRACGTSFPAMIWNNATRRKIKKDTEFIPIQHITDNPDDSKIKKLKWFCPNCSIDKPDVGVRLDSI